MTIALFILVLLTLIVGHEFGHFVVAKLARMKVLEFGIGFPPRLWGRRVGETEYTINLLPFGGFVKIFGEDEKEVGDGAIRAHPKRVQAAVIGAGPIMNVLLGFVLLTLAFMVGVPATDDGTGAIHSTRLVVEMVVPESPAARAGVMVGDTVLSAQTPDELTDRVRNSTGPLTLLVERKGDILSLTVTPERGVIADDPSRPAIGLATATIGIKQYGFFGAIGAGAVATWENLKFIFVSVVRLIGQAVTFSADLSTVAGPIGIATLTGTAAALGLGSLLSFAAILSLNLAIVNLLPFPAMDGGRLLFLAIEGLTRRRIPARVASAVNGIGFALLIVLMVLVSAHDLTRLG